MPWFNGKSCLFLKANFKLLKWMQTFYFALNLKCIFKTNKQTFYLSQIFPALI